MIINKNGDIFDSDADIICHQVNCQGTMGSGIAKTIKERYPEAYTEYKTVCFAFPKENLLGQVRIVLSGDRLIANIFGQFNYGRDKNVVYTSYKALKSGLTEVHNKALRDNLSVAIPYCIGCGLANGDWNVVSKMIEDVFNDNVVCEIWRLEK